MKKDKTILNIFIKDIVEIKTVEDKNGSIYKIGDTIRIFEKSCASYDQVFKILKFRWNVDRTHICAVTSKHSNGIRLDWIEHYIEKPKFVLPEKWCIKANSIEEAKRLFPYFNKSGDCYYSLRQLKHINYFAHYNKKKYITANLSILEHYTQITFEQFEQYVLFDGYKIGDKINTLSAKNAIITDLQYINGQSVAFFKVSNGFSSNQTRVLIKNIIK